MPTIRAAIRDAAARLAAAGVPDPGRDARRLMAHVLGLDSAALIAVDTDDLAPEPAARFDQAISARCARQPVSQITGRRAFYGRDFAVDGTVLDPRPETETLIEVALAEPFARVLDLGTGSGCILVTLLAERPDARGVGTDIDDRALLLAGENAARLGVADRITLPVSDWWGDVGGRYDLIVSNPPYIAAEEMPDLAPEVRDWEPRAALTDEADGLGAYHQIAPGAFSHLLPGGRLIVEIGHAQGEAVRDILTHAGFVDIRVHTDLGGHDRVVSGRRDP